MKKLSLFVDVQNIYYTTRSAFGRNFDYNKFWAEVTEGFDQVDAYAYAIDKGDQKQRQFQNILRAIGFTVKLKPYIQRADGSAKGDWDVGITIDVLNAASTSDRIVLASGDGDFDILVNEVKTQHQTPVTVYGAEKLTADSLIRAASSFRSIDETLLL